MAIRFEGGSHSAGILVLTMAALAAGMASGLAVHAYGAGPFGLVIPWLDALGRIWAGSLQMTVIPLVASGLVLSISGVRGSGMTRMGGLCLAVFASLLALGAGVALILGPALLGLLPEDLIIGVPTSPYTPETAGEESAGAGGFVDWLTSLVPRNPIAAAAEGELLPLLVFIVLFALALGRISQEHRAPVLALSHGVWRAMMMLVDWLFRAAPVGIFALALTMTSGEGLAGPRMVVYFVVLVCLLLCALIALLYLIASAAGGVPLARFARSVIPAQMVAAGTRSSLASLPALLEGAERRLGLAPSVSGFVLPLSVSTFKVNRTLSATIKLLFLARVYGIDMDASQVAAFLGAVAILSFSTPGIPGSGKIITLPAYLAAGLPIEGVLILEGMDVIPDVFKTVANVTADMTAAVVVQRLLGLGAPGENDLAGRETPIGIGGPAVDPPA